MSLSMRHTHRNEEGCECECHYERNNEEISYEEEEDGYFKGRYYNKNKEMEREKSNEDIKRIYSLKGGKLYETNSISLASTNGFENTISSHGNKLRYHPQSSNELMYKSNSNFNEEEEEEENENGLKNPMKTSLTYHMQSDEKEQNENDGQADDKEKYDRYRYQNDKQLRDYEQMASDFKELQWENTNLTYKLSQALKEKNGAIAMSNSLKRILDDYSNKTNVKEENEALKHLCIDENNALRDTANAYEIILDHTFDFLRFLSRREGIEMKPIGHYLNDEDNLIDLLQSINQSMNNKANDDTDYDNEKGSANNQPTKAKSYNDRERYKEDNFNHKDEEFNRNYNDNSSYPTGKFVSNQNQSRENRNGDDNNYENISQNDKQTFGFDPETEAIRNNEMNYHQRQYYDRDNSLRRERGYDDREFHPQRNSKEDEDPSKEYHRQQSNNHNDEFHPHDYQYLYRQRSNDDNEVLEQKIKDNSSRRNEPLTKGGNHNHLDTLIKSKPESNDTNKNEKKYNQALTLKRPNIVGNIDNITSSSINSDPVISSNKKLKGKTVLSSSSNIKSQQPSLKSAKFLNIKSFDKSSSNSIKGNNKKKIQPNYPSITEDSNSNVHTNESPSNTNNNKLKSKKASNEEMKTLDLKNFKSRFNLKNSISDTDTIAKAKANQDKELSIENDLKRSDSLKPNNNKSQSTIKVKMDNYPRESMSSSPTKSSKTKTKIKKAKTFFNKQRVQSPLRQDICIACSVDCNISSNGYSPMTYIPYGGKVLRKSITPVVLPL